MKLYGCEGCGSTVVEAALDLAGVTYEREVFAFGDAAAWERMKAVNPLAQVPSLVLDDGTVLTESAGLALWIAETYPATGLMPADPRTRALVYRWVAYFATNVYVPIIVGDFPARWVEGEAAGESLKAHALQRLKDAWTIFEAAIAPDPYLLGGTMTVLDLYVAMIARWRPGRTWLAEHCPRAIASTGVTAAHPVVAQAWARNFTS